MTENCILLYNAKLIGCLIRNWMYRFRVYERVGRTVADLQSWLKATEIWVDWTQKMGIMSMKHEGRALATNPKRKQYPANS